MKRECLETRDLIERSLSRPLPPGDIEAMERHCASCGACGSYRERLLADDALLAELAASDEGSVRDIERRSIGALAGAAASAPARSARRAPRIPGALRFAAAAAAVLAVAFAIDALRGFRDSPAPAFAAVLARVEEAVNVSFRTRTWYLGEWKEREIACARSDLQRVSFKDRVNIYADTVLVTLYPAEKRAVIEPRRDSTGIEETYAERLAQWHKRGEFAFVRTERLHGRKAHVYESLYFGKIRYTIWVDAGSGLPVRTAMTKKTARMVNERQPVYGFRLQDFAPPGEKGPRIAGWEPLGEDEPQIVDDRFRWNRDLDPKLFSAVPPEGYRVERRDSRAALAARERMKRPPALRNIVEGLRLWRELADGGFPGAIDELADSARVRPLIVARYDGDGPPGDEFRAAVEAAETLTRAVDAVRLLEKKSEWKYLGAGVTWGDSSKIVCWYRVMSRRPVEKPYVVVYGDLRFERAAAPPAN